MRVVEPVQDDGGHGYVNDCCPICESGSEEYLQVIWDGIKYFIDRCKNCEFLYVRNVPSHQVLERGYRSIFGQDGPFVPDTRLHKRLKNWYFAKRIKSYTKGRRILEIGYGQGHLLKALKREGIFQIEGIDYAAGPFEHLKSLGFDVSISSIERRRYPSEHFDMVVGLHVLEHVHNPVSFVREIHRILGPRGRVYLQVPCVTHWRARLVGKSWKHFSPPFHLWYFSPRTIRSFLSKHGFRVIFAHCLSNRAHLTVLAEKV